jgi:hypothetical protein
MNFLEKGFIHKMNERKIIAETSIEDEGRIIIWIQNPFLN